MGEYTLYLDESKIPIEDESKQIVNSLFVIGGVIIDNTYHNTILTNHLNSIKDKVWDKEKYKEDRHNFILHELEVTEAHYGHFGKLKNKYNKEFSRPSKYKLLYDEMSQMINQSNVIFTGACIDQNLLHKLYNKNVINDKMSILMQIIIENYFHFLVNNEATGIICYESMPKNQNHIIMKRYNNIKNTGTMFYPAKQINKRILNLEFRDKKENIPGLQLADFVPNTLGRKICNKNSNSEINYMSIESKLYDGNIDRKDKYGIKQIP